MCLKASAALVVVFELGRKLTPDYAQDIVPDLVAAYNNLITTSKKHERILQEEEREELGCAFRKILRFIRVSCFNFAWVFVIDLLCRIMKYKR